MTFEWSGFFDIILVVARVFMPISAMGFVCLPIKPTLDRINGVVFCVTIYKMVGVDTFFIVASVATDVGSVAVGDTERYTVG